MKGAKLSHFYKTHWLQIKKMTFAPELYDSIRLIELLRENRILPSMGHSNADEQGFWNLPDVVGNSEADLSNPKLLRYFIKFNYQKKSKEVTYFPNFDGNQKMKTATAKMQKIIEQYLIDADQKLSK